MYDICGFSPVNKFNKLWKLARPTFNKNALFFFWLYAFHGQSPLTEISWFIGEDIHIAPTNNIRLWRAWIINLASFTTKFDLFNTLAL